MTVNEKQLDKIRKLLAKAESTTHPEEARAFTEKAQELITQWSIDEAMLAVGRNAGGGTPSTSRTIIDYSPYQGPKEALLSVVAAANRCRVVFTKTYDRTRVTKSGRYQQVSLATLIGFPSDLQATEVLYTSLLLQSEREFQQPSVQAAMFEETWHPGHRIRWRNAYVLGYTQQISKRLHEAKKATEQKAETATPGTALVLVDRGKLVDARTQEMFPRLVSNQMSAGQGGGSGRSHGAAAANRANLGQTGVAGARGALK